MEKGYCVTLYYDFNTEYKLEDHESIHISAIHYPYDVIIDPNRAYDEFIAIYNENYKKALMKAAIEYLADFGDYISKGEIE